MIKVTFDCPDIEIATYLSVFYTLYTKEDLIDDAGVIVRELSPALGYLRDKIADAVGDDYKIDLYEFSDRHKETIEAFVDFYKNRENKTNDTDN